MKREEAIKLLKQYQGYEPMSPDEETLKHSFDLTDETVDALLTALRPVSREQVEKVWRGCEQCQPSCGTCEHMYEWDKYGKPQECTSCKENGYVNYISDSKFCEYCGRPLTDEAVQMVMERLEALKDE